MRKSVLCSLVVSTLTLMMQNVLAANNDTPVFALDRINVTANGYEKSNLETPADINVYSGEDLKKTGATNVADALKYKGGIYFTQMGPHGQNWITNASKATLRGVDNGTLILLNGVPVSFNGVNHLDNIQLEQVEKVEVLKGGGAVLYGSSAFGGVINIITKDEYKNGINIAVGNEGQRKYNATINAGKANIFVGHDAYGATENLSVKEASNSSVWGSDTKYKISFGDSKKDTFGVNYKFNDNVKLNYYFNKKDYSLNYNAIKGKTGLLQHFDYDDQEHYVQLNYANKDFDTVLYYNQRDIDNPDYRFVDNKIQREWELSTQRVYGFNSKYKFGTDTDKFLIGTEYKHEIWQDEREKFKNKDGALNDKNDSYNSDEYSIYGQYDKKLSEATDLIVSARQHFADFNNDNYSEFLPQAQLITKIDDENSVYVSAGKSFRMPNFRNLYYSSGMIKPNPDLEPEKGVNYEVGYKYDAGNARATIAVFKTNVDNQIASMDLGNGLSTPINVSEYKNTGIEVRYERDLDNHFSYNFGTVFSNPQRRYQKGDNWVDALGRYQINGGLTYVNKDTDASFNFSYWGDRVINGKNNGKFTATKIDSPLLISNLHVGHRLNSNVKLTFDVNNIFDRKDICNADTSSSLYYTQGRTFLVGMNYSF